MFNGKDLSGWVNANCAPETWNLKDGVIHCTGIPTGALRTEKQYENFMQEAEAIRALTHRYRNVPMSFADACLVRMSKLQEPVCVFTVDSDFSIYRRHGRKTIPLLSP